jgi:hypothetical protein
VISSSDLLPADRKQKPGMEEYESPLVDANPDELIIVQLLLKFTLFDCDKTRSL